MCRPGLQIWFWMWTFRKDVKPSIFRTLGYQVRGEEPVSLVLAVAVDYMQ